MSGPIKLISTDFDGTLFAEFENPPIPQVLQDLIADLQRNGAKWVINTGRDMSSLMEALGRAGIAIEPVGVSNKRPQLLRRRIKIELPAIMKGTERHRGQKSEISGRQ